MASIGRIQGYIQQLLDRVAALEGGGGGAGTVPDGDKGDITVSSSGSVFTIDAGVVTYGKIQDVSDTNKILGRSTAGSGGIEEITCTAAGRAILDDADASAQRATLGLGTVATSNIGDFATSSHNHTGVYQPLATVLTSTTASFTTAQETKLSGIATGATANSSDVTLLDRANHTGSQLISTVTGLQTALDGKSATSHDHTGVYQPLATVLTNTTASFTTAQETKLSGIETGADATDTANVTAAGALMDSEVDVDIKTLSLPANTTISTFGASLVDDSDATAARTTLGLGSLATQSGTFSGTSSGTNTGDQTSIVGIAGTKAEFDAACADGDFLYVGGVTQYTDEMAQDAVGALLVAGSNITLTYNDAGNALTIDAAGGGGGGATVINGWQTVATHSLAGLSSQAITGLTSGRYKFTFEGAAVSAAGGVQVLMTTSTNNGVSYDVGGSDYYVYNREIGGAAGASIALVNFSGGAGGHIGNTAGYGFKSTIEASGLNGTTLQKIFEYQSYWQDTGGNNKSLFGSAERNSTADIDAVNFTLTSGTFTAGTLKVETYVEATSSGGADAVSCQAIFDGLGNVIESGSKARITAPYGMTITGWSIFSDVSGSAVVDVYKDTYTNYPPTVGDSITGTEKPNLSNAIKNQDLTLNTWTTSVSAGDVLIFNVDSAAAVQYLAVVLEGTRT